MATEPVSPTIVILIDIASRLGALREAVAQMDPPGRVTRIQPEPVQAEADGLATVALAEIRKTCADVLDITLDPRDDTLALFRRVVERAQTDARALRDHVVQAEARLDLLAKYSGGIRSGTEQDADAYEAEATRSLAEGRLVNAANAQALAMINRLLVALDEQGRESERRHRVTGEDLRRHQESARGLAALINEALDVLDQLGVPSGTDVAARIREFAQARILVATGNGDVTTARLQERRIDAARLRALEPVLHAAAQIMGVQTIDPASPEEGREFAAKLHARADRHTPALLAEAAKSCAMALIEDTPSDPEAQVALIQRTAALAAQGRCALDVLDVERPLTLDDVAAHQGAATSYAAQGMPLLAKAHRLAAAAIGYRLLGRVNYDDTAQVRAVHALLDEVEVPREPGATLTDRVRVLIQRRENYSRLPEVPTPSTTAKG